MSLFFFTAKEWIVKKSRQRPALFRSVWWKQRTNKTGSLPCAKRQFFIFSFSLQFQASLFTSLFPHFTFPVYQTHSLSFMLLSWSHHHHLLLLLLCSTLHCRWNSQQPTFSTLSLCFSSLFFLGKNTWEFLLLMIHARLEATTPFIIKGKGR